MQFLKPLRSQLKLWEKLDQGEFEKLMVHLPLSLRNLQG